MAAISSPQPGVLDKRKKPTHGDVCTKMRCGRRAAAPGVVVAECAERFSDGLVKARGRDQCFQQSSTRASQLAHSVTHLQSGSCSRISPGGHCSPAEYTSRCCATRSTRTMRRLSWIV